MFVGDLLRDPVRVGGLTLQRWDRDVFLRWWCCGIGSWKVEPMWVWDHSLRAQIQEALTVCRCVLRFH